MLLVVRDKFLHHHTLFVCFYYSRHLLWTLPLCFLENKHHHTPLIQIKKVSNLSCNSMVIHWQKALVCLWCVCEVQRRHVGAFNMDTVNQNVLKRNGDPGSLFGFSLALHQQLNPVNKKL